MFFGTPPQPRDAAMGSLGSCTFVYDNKNFPSLVPGSEQARDSNGFYKQAPLSPEQAHEHGSGSGQARNHGVTFKEAILYKPNSSNTLPEDYHTPAPTMANGSSPMGTTCAPTTNLRQTRRDKQFAQQCLDLGEQIFTQQHEAAKIILKTLHESEHDPWLERLRMALQCEQPMTDTAKQSPAVKAYYKKKFTPFYTDTTPMPLPRAFGPTYDHATTIGPTMRCYDTWTDYALEIYGTVDPSPPKTSFHKRRIVRSSSSVRCNNLPSMKLSSSSSNTLPSYHEPTTTTSSSIGSKYEYQYSSHQQQHDAYAKLLGNDDNPFDYLVAYSKPIPLDTVGKFRRDSQLLYLNFETQMRRDLQILPIWQWSNVLSKYSKLLSFLQTLRPQCPQKDEVPLAQRSYLPYDDIGTGIAHHKPAHRLQKRRQRHLRFVHIACSQNSHTSRAPTSRQHRTNVVLAELLHEAAIAPLDFRQHRVSYNNLHSDYSEHMGNLISTDGGIFMPLSLSPHVVINPSFASTSSAPNFGLHSVEAHFAPRSISVGLQTVRNVHDFVLHNLYCTVPTYCQNASLIHPDGPGNVLLFDTRTLDGCGSLGNSLTTLTGISRLACFPYSHFHFNTVFSLDVPNNKITQETVTRAEKIRRKRPQRPLGPGHSHIFPPTRVYNTTDSERPTSFHYGSSSIIRPLRPPPAESSPSLCNIPWLHWHWLHLLSSAPFFQ